MITDLKNQAVIERIRNFCGSVNTVLSMQVADSLLKSPLSIKDIKVDPANYSTAHEFAHDYACVNSLKKFSGLPGTTSATRSQKALSSWLNAEESCLKTNQRIWDVLYGSNTLLNVPLGDGLEHNVTIAAMISMAQRKIERVLGPFSFYEATKECCWSSGATADLKRGTQLSKKMTEKPTVTPRAWKHARLLMAADHHWMKELLGDPQNLWEALDKVPTFIDYTRFVSVPKNAFTDRGISAEPTLNAFLQQGVGRFIRRRLKQRASIDLDSQSFNQWLAGKAHTLGYSTLDLESASDTLSTLLVMLLLPADWYAYLFDLRTPKVRFGDGREVAVQKFSAMGNAFTFELESLIFWAISSSVNELSRRGGTVAVYGDDIIVPRGIARSVIDALRWCGFSLNMEKSFIDGAFFESCGAHFFAGVNVTPFYQKNPVKGLPEVIRFHNRLVRWSVRINGSPFSKATKAALVGLITDKSPCIPISCEGDDGFLVTRSELSRRFKYSLNYGFKCRVIAFRGALEPCYRDGAFYAYKLRNFSYQNADPRGRAMVSSASGSWIQSERWIHCTGD